MNESTERNSCSNGRGVDLLKVLAKYNDNDIQGLRSICISRQLLRNVTSNLGIDLNPNILKSMCFHNVDLPGDYINIARSLVVNLVLSPFNSSDGIRITADMPYSKHCDLNICRPAVLRIYYGRNIENITPTVIQRYTYGPILSTGTLSIDPRQFSTKVMSEHMYKLGNILLTYIKGQIGNGVVDQSIFHFDMNHCTVLIYRSQEKNVNIKLPYHCDSHYDRHGKFLGSNTQGENTPVIILTLGDKRNLYLTKRYYKSKEKKWVVEKRHLKQFILDDKSIFFLHPDDEYPRIRNKGEEISQIQHGVFRFEEGSLSFAMVFRNVTQIVEYDNITGNRIIPRGLLDNKQYLLNQFDNTYDKYYYNMQNLERLYKEFCMSKFEEWKWLKKTTNI